MVVLQDNDRDNDNKFSQMQGSGSENDNDNRIDRDSRYAIKSVSSLIPDNILVSTKSDQETNSANDPVIPQVPRVDETASVDEASRSESINLLRRFHFGDPVAAEHTAIPGDSILPALLNPYRGVSRFRHEYPLYLRPASDEDEDDGCLAQPLDEFLLDAVEAFAPEAESSRILKDNLPWIERHLYEQMMHHQAPLDAKPLLMDAGNSLQDHIGLASTNREILQRDLDKLQEKLAENSQFLAYGPNIAIHLLRHTIRNHTVLNRQKFQNRLEKQIRGLNQLLAIEREKSLSAKDPEVVKGRVGAASRYFDSSALSGVLEHRSHGSLSMPAQRLQRITQVLERLQSFTEEPDPVRFIAAPGSSWLKNEDTDDINFIEDPDPCAKAVMVYDEEAARHAKIFSASRIAELELDGKYDDSVHDSWFDSFNWEAFSQQELHLVPIVIALESAERIAGEGLGSFSHLLNARRPVQILTSVHAHSNPGAGPEEDPLHSFRLELAYFGIGHRQAVVTQPSASRYEQLLSAFITALNSTRTSLHLVNTGFSDKLKQPPLDPWIMASAALESRAHPFIQVNPGGIDNSQAHMNLEGNAHPGLDWSTHSFSYRDESGEMIETELSFTFADYCLLFPELQKHFREVPGGCDDEDLVAIAAYLAAPSDTLNRLVPFVWAVDSEGVLQKLVISRGLVLACRDRQSYWRTLQSLTGVRNDYVELATQKAHEEERAAAAIEREQLLNEHALELERVRAETAGEVMGQLTDVLLGLDLSSLSSAGTLVDQVSTPAPTGETPADGSGNTAEDTTIDATVDKSAASQTEQETSDEDEISFDEPWIDAIFCTTCDDCMAINKQMFAYNDNKQAFITDPRSGTFAQLVAAAELCPARCIHPGKPLDPDEPGLDELIKRAEPYNS